MSIALDNGASALLLQLYGTLPIQFRGVEYRFPITVWIPHHYPREAPMVYVTPTQEMAVRPGQYISAEGRIYHPYLAQWANYWDVSRIVQHYLHKLCRAHREVLCSNDMLIYLRPHSDQPSSIYCRYSQNSSPRSHQ